MTGKMKAYTLIELIIVLVVIGIVAGAGVPIMLETADAWFISSKFQDNAVSNAMLASSRMSREIRRLLNDASVTTATASAFSFTDIGSNSITYNLSSTSLMRNSDTLAENVSALTYTYYDDNGNAIATPVVSPNNTDIRRIQVNFSILAGSNTLNFQFGVRPQNLRRFSEKFK